MPKGVAVFDLDSTIGDFTSIDFFSYIYDIDTILRGSSTSDKIKVTLKKEYKNYSTETKDFLIELRDNFEVALDKYGYTELILRTNIDNIFSLLINQIDKKSLAGCMIYSNNGNPYTLEFAGRALERAFDRKDIFFAYLDRNNPIRDEFDGNKSGARKKTVATIQKTVKEFRNINDLEPSDIIFFDDLIHDDLADKNVNYVHVKAFYSTIHQDILKEMFSLFEDILYKLFKKYKDMGEKFFNLYHIRNIAHVSSIEGMEEAYLNHSRENYHSHFVSDYPEIKDKLYTYIELIQKYKNSSGGKRKRTTKRNKKTSKKSVKKNRTRY